MNWPTRCWLKWRASSYARQSQLGTSAINHATVIKIRAERKLADIVDEGQARGDIAEQGRPDKRAHCAPFPPAPLGSIGIEKERLAEARILRDYYTDEELAAKQAEANDRDEILSRRRLLLEARAALRTPSGSATHRRASARTGGARLCPPCPKCKASAGDGADHFRPSCKRLGTLVACNTSRAELRTISPEEP